MNLNNPTIDQERLKDKTKLVLKVNYVSSGIAILFGLACYFFLNITEIIPHTLIGFGVINLINTFAFNAHKNLELTFTTSSIIAVISAFIIILYSGGINSSFIFILPLIVFAGYVTTRKYGQIYLNLIFLFIIAIYSQSIPDFTFTYNVIPQESQNVFSLFSVLFSIYLLGNVFGKNLLRTHHNLYRTKSALVKELNEKETLLQEVHHRVKNNLQTVSSLLSLQSRAIEDQKTKELIKATQNRVISMSMVHEMLYMRSDISKIEYKSYVQELSEFLIKSIKGIENKIKLDIDIPNIKLGIDTAIPLGLLINETITNSLKYGFCDEDQGEIHIALKKDPNKDYVLNIGDNGIGFPETVDFKNTKSLGLKLIHNLTRQLRGSVTRDNSKKGTNYVIRFQEIDKEFSAI